MNGVSKMVTHMLFSFFLVDLTIIYVYKLFLENYRTKIKFPLASKSCFWGLANSSTVLAKNGCCILDTLFSLSPNLISIISYHDNNLKGGTEKSCSRERTHGKNNHCYSLKWLWRWEAKKNKGYMDWIWIEEKGESKEE